LHKIRWQVIENWEMYKAGTNNRTNSLVYNKGLDIYKIRRKQPEKSAVSTKKNKHKFEFPNYVTENLSSIFWGPQMCSFTFPIDVKFQFTEFFSFLVCVELNMRLLKLIFHQCPEGALDER
jgi:hypothetical protein